MSAISIEMHNGLGERVYINNTRFNSQVKYNNAIDVADFASGIYTINHGKRYIENT